MSETRTECKFNCGHEACRAWCVHAPSATPPTPDRAADSNNREMTDEEGERLFDALQRIADAEPISEERLARIREGVLRRRGMVPAMPADVQAAVERVTVTAKWMRGRIITSTDSPSLSVSGDKFADDIDTLLAHLTREAR